MRPERDAATSREGPASGVEIARAGGPYHGHGSPPGGDYLSADKSMALGPVPSVAPMMSGEIRLVGGLTTALWLTIRLAERAVKPGAPGSDRRSDHRSGCADRPREPNRHAGKVILIRADTCRSGDGHLMGLGLAVEVLLQIAGGRPS
jgi:hypothetical protein